MPLLTTIGLFVAIAGAVLIGVSLFAELFLRDKLRVHQRIDEEFRGKVRKQAEKSSLFNDLKRLTNASIDLSQHDSLMERLTLMIEQSGLNFTVPRLLMSCGVASSLFGMLGFVLTKNYAVIVLATIIGAVTPIASVSIVRKRRQMTLLAQLPDAFDLMARAVRAGNSFWQSVQAVSEEFEAPLAMELAYAHEMQNLGLPTQTALRELGRRTGLVEIKILVEAVTVQEQTGGNLGEMLDRLNHLVRGRFRILGKIKTLTAEGRMQAVVLLALAPAMFLIMLALNYDYAQELVHWNHGALLIGALTCEGLGWLWIRKIVNFDF
ncbi:MAG: type II secretion system F family protein [Planctomycetota bacterium]|nr:type II secretion system F family protein [Planctomycetota bacterium]